MALVLGLWSYIVVVILFGIKDQEKKKWWNFILCPPQWAKVDQKPLMEVNRW